jgi:hypothetical protein
MEREDVVSAILGDIDECELDNYYKLASFTMQCYDHEELRNYAATLVPDVTLKKIIFFTVLNRDMWFKNFVTSKEHECRDRPPLDTTVRPRFFFYLSHVCDQYSDSQVTEEEFLESVKAAYENRFRTEGQQGDSNGKKKKRRREKKHKRAKKQKMSE